MNKNKFLIDLSESEKTDFGRLDFNEQSEPQKTFSAIWELESQVNNGGFDQYLRQGDSDAVAYAPTALRAIGAKSCAEIVARAMHVIAPLPPTQNGRYDSLDSLGGDGAKQLEQFDAQFLAYPDNLTELLFRFVSQHPVAFGPIPE